MTRAAGPVVTVDSSTVVVASCSALRFLFFALEEDFFFVDAAAEKDRYRLAIVLSFVPPPWPHTGPIEILLLTRGGLHLCAFRC
jgi:hypothetical protein